MIASQSPTTEAAACSPAPVLANPARRILVVDDDEDIRQVSARVLRHFGFQTETAADGAAAWEALQAAGYDLLITDHNMPEVSGAELVKKVRSARMTLPVILASGAMPTHELDGNAWMQPLTTLVKPFSGVQLVAMVRAVLAQPAVSAVHEEMLPA